jgi:hypothetical protein
MSLNKKLDMFEHMRRLAEYQWLVHPQDKACLLFDGAAHLSWLPDFKVLWPERTWISLYEDLPEGASPEYTPCVFVVDPPWLMHEAAQAWLLSRDNASQGRICLFWTPMALAPLASHLKQHIQLLTPGGKTALLRIQDPDVLPHALQCMSHAQLQHFFNPIRLLCWTDLDQRWLQRAGGGVSSLSKPTGPWPWSHQQLQQLETALMPRKILAHLQQEHQEWLGASQEGWLQKVQAWVKQALSLGIDSPAALRLYCSLALTVGDDFMESPEVTRQVQQASGLPPSNGFLKAMGAVSESIWDQLAQRKLAPRLALHPRDAK